MQPFAADLPGTPPVDSGAFWSAPYKVAAATDPDSATAQTIGIMCQHVKNAARDTGVVATARGAAGQFAGLGVGSDAERIAGAAFWWCKTFVKFVHHEFIIRKRLGEAGHLQGLISPEVLVRMAKPEGDCAIFSECVAAFLTTFGIPFEFVTVAANPDEPEVFSHVYLYAVLPEGERLPLDASHGAYPGWQVPSGHVSRRQVWDSDGEPVSDQGSRFDGLHSYRGLGDTQSDWDAFMAAGGFDQYVDPYSYVSLDNVPYTANQVYVAPTQDSSQWASFATSLAKMGFDLAKINAIQPGTVVGAQGQILRQNPGYSVPATGTGIQANLGGSGNIVLYGVIGLLALLAVGSMKGGK